MRKLLIKKILYCCVVIGSLANSAHSQNNDQTLTPANPFEGIALQAAVGYQPYSIRASNIVIGPAQLKLPDQHYTGSSTPYFAGLSYTTALTDRATVGVQIEVNPINEQYVLSLLPGYSFTSSIQGYFKLAWVNALVTVDQAATQGKVSATANGLTAGLGVKQLWTKNWYGFVEANYVKMNAFKFNSSLLSLPINGNADYSGYNAMVGVGYKF